MFHRNYCNLTKLAMLSNANFTLNTSLNQRLNQSRLRVWCVVRNCCSILTDWRTHELCWKIIFLWNLFYYATYGLGNVTATQLGNVTATISCIFSKILQIKFATVQSLFCQLWALNEHFKFATICRTFLLISFLRNLHSTFFIGKSGLLTKH